MQDWPGQQLVFRECNERSQLYDRFGEKSVAAQAATDNASGYDASVLTGFRGVGGEGFVGFEVFVALDGQSEFAANCAEFVETDEAKFRGARICVWQLVLSCSSWV